jgi:hypothetical protein
MYLSWLFGGTFEFSQCLFSNVSYEWAYKVASGDKNSPMDRSNLFLLLNVIPVWQVLLATRLLVHIFLKINLINYKLPQLQWCGLWQNFVWGCIWLRRILFISAANAISEVITSIVFVVWLCNGMLLTYVLWKSNSAQVKWLNHVIK